jgi:peroxiredoxin
MTLALNLRFRARIRQRIKIASKDVRAKLIKEYQALWGKPAVQELMKHDPKEMVQESVKFLAQVRDKYGKTKHPLHGTLAKMAETYLDALAQPVRLGGPAPEIRGKDLDGKNLKLSDHRGKVVVLEFGAHEFPSCQGAYPILRAVVEKNKKRPLMVLGVSGDPSASSAAKVREAEKLPGRVWFDRGGPGGPIASRWDVELWPTWFVIDHKGVVRHVEVGRPELERLEKVLGPLLTAADKAGANPLPKDGK